MGDESLVQHTLRVRGGLYAYTTKRHNLGKYYFVVDAKLLQLITNLLDTNKNKSQGNALIFGAWGCSKDLMLRELGLNDPESGPVLGN